MAFFDKVLHKTKSRPPPELVAKTMQALERLSEGSISDKLLGEVAQYLSQMKAVMFGAADSEASRDTATQLAYEAVKYDLPLVLVQKLPLLEFESRKDAAQIVGAIVRLDSAGDSVGVRFVLANSQMLQLLFAGYDNADVALNCGSMLRDCIKDHQIAQLVLEGPLFYQFFDKVEVSNFEVASDAFATFKDLLTRHKYVVATFLNEHYDQCMTAYTRLLKSENYVTRRQSLKLLGEILLDRANVKAMMRYVSDAENLKLMMVLLKDPSRSIQFEAFHVFKVFVANPNKTQQIIDILAGNKDKLLKYLGDFHAEKDDEQFKEEKAVIIKEISSLTPSDAAGA